MLIVIFCWMMTFQTMFNIRMNQGLAEREECRLFVTWLFLLFDMNLQLNIYCVLILIVVNHGVCESTTTDSPESWSELTSRKDGLTTESSQDILDGWVDVTPDDHYDPCDKCSKREVCRLDILTKRKRCYSRKSFSEKCYYNFQCPDTVWCQYTNSGYHRCSCLPPLEYNFKTDKCEHRTALTPTPRTSGGLIGSDGYDVKKRKFPNSDALWSPPFTFLMVFGTFGLLVLLFAFLTIGCEKRWVLSWHLCICIPLSDFLSYIDSAGGQKEMGHLKEDPSCIEIKPHVNWWEIQSFGSLKSSMIYHQIILNACLHLHHLSHSMLLLYIIPHPEDHLNPVTLFRYPNKMLCCILSSSSCAFLSPGNNFFMKRNDALVWIQSSVSIWDDMRGTDIWPKIWVEGDSEKRRGWVKGAPM